MIAQNKQLVRELIGILNKQDFEALENLVSQKVMGEFKNIAVWVNNVWPDHQTEIVDMLAEGDQVWCKTKTSGTHTGEWEGIPATGKHWTNTTVAFFRVTDNRVVEQDWLSDALHHIKQLGATVMPPNAAQ